jgi:hypothetical protein
MRLIHAKLPDTQIFAAFESGQQIAKDDPATWALTQI